MAETPFSFRGLVDENLRTIELRVPQQPRVVEFGVLGVIAVGEAMMRGISQRQQWREVWRRHCRLLHPDDPSRTLGDLPSAAKHDETSQMMASQERETGMRQVKRGMEQIWMQLRKEGDGDGRRDDPHLAAIDRLIAEALDSLDEFPDPGSAEAYLYALMSMRVRFMPPNLQKDVFDLWRDEVHRFKHLGAAATRTLADVVPARELRARIEKAAGEGRDELLASYRQIRKEVSAIIEELALP
jgi:hypothetical protein